MIVACWAAFISTAKLFGKPPKWMRTQFANHSDLIVIGVVDINIVSYLQLMVLRSKWEMHAAD
jgi:hypothetical protein